MIILCSLLYLYVNYHELFEYIAFLWVIWPIYITSYITYYIPNALCYVMNKKIMIYTTLISQPSKWENSPTLTFCWSIATQSWISSYIWIFSGNFEYKKPAGQWPGPEWPGSTTWIIMPVPDTGAGSAAVIRTRTHHHCIILVMTGASSRCQLDSDLWLGAAPGRDGRLNMKVRPRPQVVTASESVPGLPVGGPTTTKDRDICIELECSSYWNVCLRVVVCGLSRGRRRGQQLQVLSY